MEVYYNGQWGTVCDDGWDLNDAQVVCRELNFGTAIAARYNAYYGQGIGPIWLDDLKCTGVELTIKNCAHTQWGIHNCKHRDDAGIQCSAPSKRKFIHTYVCYFNSNIRNYHACIAMRICMYVHDIIVKFLCRCVCMYVYT